MTSPPIVIRDATPDDFETVVVLELEIFGRSAWSPQSVDAEFAGLGSSRALVLAEMAGDAVGYAVLRYVDEVADLQRVAVRHTHRRRGIGEQLVTRLLERACGLACERALLDVAATNQAAVGLYAALGFVEIARRKRYYPGDVDALVMELLLSDGAAREERSP
ncbi:MAG: GNAT family N-acetyltransferase [Nocardioidaceae bacterium]